MLTVLHEGLVHVPKHERNIFLQGADRWWNTRCNAIQGRLIDWIPDRLIDDAVITCLWCLVDVLSYKAQYGRYPT